MHRFSWFALIAILASISSNARGQNLLANPGFDQSLAGWALGNFNPQWNEISIPSGTQPTPTAPRIRARRERWYPAECPKVVA